VIFAERALDLDRRLSGAGSLLVALSGGVDSVALLGAAARALPGRVVAATAHSPAVPGEEVETAAEAARFFGVPHRIVETEELSRAGYRENAGARCYFCRVEMYGRFSEVARAEGLRSVADGLQADDPASERPGLRAAGEFGVLHPLREAGLGKEATRRLARGLGWRLFDKPAQPCLASRLPVGIAVTRERLALVHRAESALRSLGFREVRVRCEGRHGRIEVGTSELSRAGAEEAELLRRVVAAGFATAALDPRGYRPGGAG